MRSEAKASVLRQLRDDANVTGHKVNIRPGASVLGVLRHLNYKPWFALAEFVDNALQSFIQNREELRRLHGDDFKLVVEILVDTAAPSRITVRDNAAGIALRDFPRAFRAAAIPPDASGLSEFGMGMKSAACWFSRHWSVRTKALGDDVERTVRLDVATIVNGELEEVDVVSTVASRDSHYTEVILDGLHHVPVGRTLGKIKEHLSDIYRTFFRSGELELRFNRDVLSYEEPRILVAPYVRDAEGAERVWRKEIDFEFGRGQRVSGFAALRDPGNHAKSGFSLFRRGRLIQGGGDEGYRPSAIFLQHGSYRYLRLFGELHLEGFEVSHTKDGFRWDEDEQPFLDLLRDHLDDDDLPLLRQADLYRALASRRERASAAEEALDHAAAAIGAEFPDLLPILVEEEPVGTRTEPLPTRPQLAERTLSFDFRGRAWRISIQLVDDPAEGQWLAISDQCEPTTPFEIVEIRMNMAHPFMVAFAQTDPRLIEPVLRIGAALALAEKLARRSGTTYAGTVRRNVNDILREALSRPS